MRRHGKKLFLFILLALSAATQVLAAPVADFSASNTVICSGQSTVFTSLSTGTITSYSWNFGTGASPSSSTASGPVTVVYSSVGLKTISLTVTGPDGSDTKTLTNYVQVNAIPAAPPTPSGPESVCAGAAGVSYSVSSVSGATGYMWSVPSGASVVSGSGTNQIQVNYGATGGSVCVSASNACGTGPSTCKAVTVGKERIKLMSYNLLNYPDGSAFTADTTLRNPFYRTVLQAAQPDILVTEENQTQTGVTGFLNFVLNSAIGGFSAGTFIDGFDTDNAIFFKNSKFSFVSNTRIRTDLRDINEFKLIHLLSGDTLRIYAVHLKASGTASDEAQRALEVDSLRKVTNALPAGSNFIVCGDFNIYNSSESAYQKLLSSTGGADGRFLDPINMTGTWNYSGYAPYHTQSPRIRAFGGGTTGGLDDRFDMILYSAAIGASGGITYVPGSTVAFGNDGNHYNDSINHPPNAAVSQAVADAIHNASDHIPVTVLLDFENTSCPFADAGAVSFVDPLSAVCATGTQRVSVKVKNYGASTLNLSFNNLTVSAVVTKPGGQVQQISEIVNTGSLNAGAELSINFSQTIDISTTGNYSIRAYTSLAGDTILTNDTAAAFQFTVYTNSSSSITAGGPTTFCSGSSVILFADTNGSNTYRWQLNGIDIAGATNPTLQAASGGSYRAILQRTNSISASFPAATFLNSTAYSIPNNSCTGASSPIAVSGYAGAVAASGISIKINITHPYVGDLALFLETPAGERLGLSNRTGNTTNAGDNFTNTIFSDAGAAILPTTGAPYTGTYKPWSPVFTSCVSATITTFAAIGGGSINPNGTWKLWAYDRASSNTGSITGWEITFPAYTASQALVCDPVYSSSINVNSIPPPSISISPASGGVCSGGSVTLSASGAVSYAWSPSTGLSATTGSTVVATPSTTTNYTVTGTDGNGCTGTNSVNVTISTPPVVTLSAFSPVCLNASPFTLSGGSPAGGTYSGSGVSNGLFNPATAGAGIKNISYTYTDASGCSVTASSTIEVRALPTATTTPSGSTILCQGNTLTINAAPSFTYSWSTGATTQSISVSTAGSYTVTVADQYGCSATATPVTVSVSSFQMSGIVFTETMGTVSTTTSIATHEANNGFDNDNLTMSGSGDVRVTNLSSGYTGASGGANVFLTNTAGKNFIISGINTAGMSNLQLSFGIYKSNTTGNGSDLAIQVSSDGTNYTPLTMTLLSTGTGTATWFYRTIGTGIPATSNLSLQFLQGGTATQYRIDDIRLSYTITSPFISASGNTAFCQGSGVTLTASASMAYLWDDGSTSQSIYATATANRFCTVTGSNGCLATTNTVSTTVSPQAYTITGGGTACSGSNGVAVGLDGSETNSTYQLRRNGITIGTALNGNGNALSFGNQGTSGTYTVFCTNATTGCSATMTGSAIVTISQTPAVYTLSGGGTYCTASNGVNAQLSGSETGVTYQLYAGNTALQSPVSGTGGSITWSGLTTAGTYSVIATNSASGCTTTMSGSVNVSTQQAPLIFITTGGGFICPGDTGRTIGLNGSEAGVSYAFMRNGSIFGSTLTGTGAPLSFGQQTTSGTYSITATGTNGCTSTMSGTASIQVMSAPLIFNITGGGPYCSTQTGGSTIGLSGSEIGASYELYLNGVVIQGTSVTGNGGLLTFGDFSTPGTYTVIGSRLSTGCALPMNGSVTVSIIAASRWYMDADLDGFGNNSVSLFACTQPTGYVADSSDCNDNDASLNPGSTEICGNGIDDDCDGLIDENCPSLLTVKVFIEGFYRGAGQLAAVLDPVLQPQVCDSVQLLLAVTATPHAKIFYQTVLLSTTGIATLSVPAAYSGASYYLLVSHRNSLQCWSALPVALNGSAVNYDFTIAASKSYGNNLAPLPDGKFALFSGDVNQDEVIDFSDMNIFESGATQLLQGYVVSDLTGDGIVESADGSVLEKNATIRAQTIKP